MNTYKQQATDFLKKTNTTCEIKLAEVQKAPLWTSKGEKHGLHYIVTLKNNNGKYTFDFWNSIRNREIIEAIETVSKTFYGDRCTPEYVRAEKILKKSDIQKPNYKTKEELKAKYTPTEYDILACLSPLYEDTFEDFCHAFGYEEDSITALKTYDACREQDRMLRRLFSSTELELLEERN